MDVTALKPYFPGESATLTTTTEHAILDLVSETDEPEDDWFEAGHLTGSLTPLRAGLVGGDLRVAYLAWLLAVQTGEVESGGLEPPLPRGLGCLPAPLAAVAEFLRIDQDLLAAATEAAAHEEETRDPGRFREWVRHLPAGERERWLLRAADHPSLALGLELLGAFHRAYPPVMVGQRRTVAELLARAEELQAERRRAAADRAAQARAAAAAARDKRLATLARRGVAAWQDLDRLRRADPTLLGGAARR